MSNEVPDSRIGYKFAYTTLSDETTPDAVVLGGAAMEHQSPLQGNRTLNEPYFQVLKLWLDLIARRTGHEVHDPEVHHAYVLGSPLLDKVFTRLPGEEASDMVYAGIHRCMVEKFPRFEDMPPSDETRRPHHNLHVDVYGIASNPSATEEQITLCRVIPGILLDDDMMASVVGSHDDLRLPARDKFALQPDLGSLVATHRGIIIAKLDEPGARRLIKYGFPDS
ncbi:MAG: hypothetical protein ABIA93_06165 [Candidatus Woesearchaeota archaeon]